MAQTPKETEKKVRALSSQAEKPKDGSEMQTFQAGQNEILGIQQQQQQLLREQMLQQQARGRENAVLAQAGELGVMAAATSGPSQQLAGQVSRMQPQTQATLAKYGVKPQAPKVQTQRKTTQQVTPQRIQITNNNITTTKNDIKVTQPTIPMKQVAVGAGAGIGAAAMIGKFKTWMSNVFAKQREEDQVRAKEYQRKEWSLNHSASRMMRGLEKLGKTFAERLDPRKLAKGNMTTSRMLSTLITMATLAEYWPKILDTINKIAGFFGVGKGEGGTYSWENSGLYNMLKTLLGGKDGESLGESFVKYFWSAGERDAKGNVKNQGIINYWIDKLKDFFTERADAVSQIKFPEINIPGTDNGILSGIFGFFTPIFKNIGLYLKDIFSAMLNGKSALSAIAERNATGNFISSITGGRNSASDASTHKDSNHYNDLIDGGNGEEVFRGDRAVFFNSGGKKQNYLNEDDIDSDGILKNNVGSSARLSASLTDYARGNNTDNITQLITGLGLLQKNALGFEDGVTVDSEFIKGLVDTYDLDKKYLNQKRKYKLVKLDKEESEIYDKSSTESFSDRVNNSWIGSFWKNVFTAGNYGKSKYEQGIAEAERFKEEDANHKVYRLVPMSYPAQSVDGEEYSFNYLTYKDFEDIHNDLDRKAGITRAEDDTFSGKFTTSDHDFASGMLKYVSGKKANQAVDNVSQQLDLNLYQAKLDNNVDSNAIHTGEIKTLDEDKLREDIKSRLSRDEFIDRAWKYGGLDKDEKYLDLMPGGFFNLGDKKLFEKYKDELYDKYVEEQVANAKFLFNNLTEEEKNSGRQAYKHINGQAVSYNGNKYAQKWADNDVTEWYEFPTQSETFSGTYDDWLKLAEDRKKEAVRKQLQLDSKNAQAANNELGLGFTYLTNKNISTALTEESPTERKNISNEDTLKLQEDIIKQKGWSDFYDFNKHEFKPYNSFTKDKLSKRKEAEEETKKIVSETTSYISSNPDAGKHYFEESGVTIDTKKYGTVEDIPSSPSSSTVSEVDEGHTTRAGQGADDFKTDYIDPITDKLFGRISNNRISGDYTISESSMSSVNSIRESLRNNLGINDTAISGVLGNLYRESRLDPTAVNPSSNAQGIAQWLGDRKAKLESYYKTQTGQSAEVKDIPLQYQVDFMIQEAKNRRELMEELKKIPNDHSNDSVVKAADIWLRGYEFGSDKKMVTTNRLQRETSNQGGYNAFQEKGAGFALDIDQRSGSTAGYNSNVKIEGATYSGFTPSNNSDVVSWIQTNVQGKHNTYADGKNGTSAGGFKVTGDNDIQTDCSSMARKAYKEITGYDIGSNTGDQIKKGTWVDEGGVKQDSTVYNPQALPHEAALQPGDLLFYRKNGELDSIHKARDYGVGHVEVYIGNGKKIGTGGTKDVNPTPLDTLPGNQTYIGAKRYIDSKGNAAANLKGSYTGSDDNSMKVSSGNFDGTSDSSSSGSGIGGFFGSLKDAMSGIFDAIKGSFDGLAQLNSPENRWHSLSMEESKRRIKALETLRSQPFTEEEIKSKDFARYLTDLDPENEYVRVWSATKPGEFYLETRKKTGSSKIDSLVSTEDLEKSLKENDVTGEISNFKRPISDEGNAIIQEYFKEKSWETVSPGSDFDSKYLSEWYKNQPENIRKIFSDTVREGGITGDPIATRIKALNEADPTYEYRTSQDEEGNVIIQRRDKSEKYGINNLTQEDLDALVDRLGDEDKESIQRFISMKNVPLSTSSLDTTKKMYEDLTPWETLDTGKVMSDIYNSDNRLKAGEILASNGNDIPNMLEQLDPTHEYIMEEVPMGDGKQPDRILKRRLRFEYSTPKGSVSPQEIENIIDSVKDSSSEEEKEKENITSDIQLDSNSELTPAQRYLYRWIPIGPETLKKGVDKLRNEFPEVNKLEGEELISFLNEHSKDFEYKYTQETGSVSRRAKKPDYNVPEGLTAVDIFEADRKSMEENLEENGLDDITNTVPDLTSDLDKTSIDSIETSNVPSDWKTLTNDAVLNTIASLEKGPDGHEFFKAYYKDRSAQGLAATLSKYDLKNDYKAEILTSDRGRKVYVFKRRPKEKSPELTSEQRAAGITSELLISNWEKSLGIRPEGTKVDTDILSSGIGDIGKAYDTIKNGLDSEVLSPAEIFSDCTKALIAGMERNSEIVMATAAQVAQNTPSVSVVQNSSSPQMIQPFTT